MSNAAASVKTLVLDLDGTLIDSVPDLRAALNRLFVGRGLAPFGYDEVAAMVGNGAQVLLTRAFAARDTDYDPAAFDIFLADYTDNAAVDTRVYPGVPETLRRFADDGWRIAVCTNKPEAPARVVLDALGIAPFLAAVGGGDSFPVKKPDPAHLLATLSAAGGSADAAVMVGDHHNDVMAATGAGLPCIFAAWGYGPLSMADGAARIAQRFTDLPELAEGLVAR
jgi:phosphoglycolate phosphatase